MSYDAAKTVRYAQSQVGFREVPDGSNCNPYSDWQYGVRCPGGGWCISFASRCAVEGGFRFEGATHGSKGFSFTESAEAWARPRGLWRDRSWHALPGDWIIFEFGGGYPTDHGEMVHTDDGVWIVTIGGNTSNAVKYRRRDRRYVVGFVAFSQSDQAQVAPPPTPPPAPAAVQIKEHDMVILPGIGVPPGRRRVADLDPSGLFIRVWNGGRVADLDGHRDGDDDDMRRCYPRNADGSHAPTSALPLDGLELTDNLKFLVAKRKDGSTYDIAVFE